MEDKTIQTNDIDPIPYYQSVVCVIIKAITQLLTGLIDKDAEEDIHNDDFNKDSVDDVSQIIRVVEKNLGTKKTILNSLILSVCVATIILAINSPHYDNLMQYTRLVLLELITKYFVICYAFLSIQKNQDLRPCLQVSYYGLLILSAFAILNYIRNCFELIKE